MKSFWISLLVFVLLMCSCRSKKVVSDVQSDVRHVSGTAYLNETAQIDTSRTAYFANELKNIVIEEDINEVEYDAESGKPVKETTTKRKIIQNSDKVVAEKEQKRVEIHSRDTLKHFRGATKKVESETETVKENHGLNPFGKYSGIVIGLVIGLIIVYLLDKMRIN